MTFPISKNRKGFCFNPLTCPTPEGHIVVWCNSTDDEFEESFLWASVYKKSELDKKVKIGNLKYNDNMLFFLKFSDELYVISVETENGTNLYFINDELDLTITQHLSNKLYYEIINCWKNDETVYLLNYNFEEQVLYLCSISDGTTWDNGKVVQYYNDICTIPYVHVFKDKLIIGWTDENNTLKVLGVNLNGKTLPVQLEIDDYNVNYVCSAIADDNLVVFGGCDGRTNTLRLDFFRSTDTEFSHVASKYWKSDEYKGLSFTMTSLNRGFMLLADGPEQKGVYAQRFTHIGSWLYPLTNILEPTNSCWSPSLSHSTDTTLLVYVKDYSDTDEPFSSIWGKYVKVGNIPELDDFTL